MTERESFYAIRLTDGDLIYDEFKWMECEGPDDWTIAVEADHVDPTEYEIVKMIVEPIARRMSGVFHAPSARTVRDGNPVMECDYCGEPWPCDDAITQEDHDA